MKSLLNNETHFNIYFFSLLLAAGFMPLSPFMLSVSMFVITLNWLIEGNYKQKLNRFIKSDALIVFLLIYCAHIIWLINTSDFQWGTHDIRLKLPLFVFPVLIATSSPLTLNHIKYIIATFVLAVVINSLISTVVFFLSDKAFYNIREISLFISHIRFSLMVVISIGCLLYFIFSYHIQKTNTEKLIYSVILLWLIIFLFILRSFTGILIMFLLFFFILFWIKQQVKRKYLSNFIYLFTTLFILYFFINIIYSMHLYYRENKDQLKNLEKYTLNGNPYNHYIDNNERENGNYIWIYLSEKEMANEWNKVSDIDYNKKDKKGQSIQYTIIRYLTSKGYKKDSTGISKLNKKDIELIENGVANYIYGKRFGIYPRIYEIIWEIDKYIKGKNPSGHSFTQRFEYIKTGISIIKENFWFGVGTGDVPDAFALQYKKSNTELNPSVRLRTHNQYITFFISFGFFGFLITITGFVYPIIKNRKKLFFVSYIFIAVMFISMINEDTLETHIGVSLISYLYAVFIFGYDGSKNSDNLKQTYYNIKSYLKLKS